MAELGWLGLPLPESLGGYAGRWLNVALLMQRFGRALVVEPYVANVVLAGGLLARVGSQVQRLLELLMIAAGPDALAYHREFVLGTASAPAFGPAHAATAAGRYFKWRPMSIIGGSNEIQRNVVAKAVLDIR